MCLDQFHLLVADRHASRQTKHRRPLDCLLLSQYSNAASNLAHAIAVEA